MNWAQILRRFDPSAAMPLAAALTGFLFGSREIDFFFFIHLFLWILCVLAGLFALWIAEGKKTIPSTDQAGPWASPPAVFAVLAATCAAFIGLFFTESAVLFAGAAALSFAYRSEWTELKHVPVVSTLTFGSATFFWFVAGYGAAGAAPLNAAILAVYFAALFAVDELFTQLVEIDFTAAKGRSGAPEIFGPAVVARFALALFAASFVYLVFLVLARFLSMDHAAPFFVAFVFQVSTFLVIRDPAGVQGAMVWRLLGRVTFLFAMIAYLFQRLGEAF